MITTTFSFFGRSQAVFNTLFRIKFIPLQKIGNHEFQNKPIDIDNTQIIHAVLLRVLDHIGECLLCVVCAQVGADGRAVVRRGVMGERNVVRSVRIGQYIRQGLGYLLHIFEALNYIRKYIELTTNY